MRKKLITGLVVLVGVLLLYVILGFTSNVSFFKQDIIPLQIEANKARILILGDLLFDRSIRTYANENGFDYIFACMKDQLLTYDAVLANLEGPITSNKSVSATALMGEPGNTRFTF